MLITIANCTYPVLAMIGMILLAHRKKSAFVVFLFVEILMFYIGAISGQWGIAVMAVMYFITNIYSYCKWAQEDKRKERVKIVDNVA